MTNTIHKKRVCDLAESYIAKHKKWDDLNGGEERRLNYHAVLMALNDMGELPEFRKEEFEYLRKRMERRF